MKEWERLRPKTHRFEWKITLFHGVYTKNIRDIDSQIYKIAITNFIAFCFSYRRFVLQMGEKDEGEQQKKRQQKNVKRFIHHTYTYIRLFTLVAHLISVLLLLLLSFFSSALTHYSLSQCYFSFFFLYSFSLRHFSSRRFSSPCFCCWFLRRCVVCKANWMKKKRRIDDDDDDETVCIRYGVCSHNVYLIFRSRLLFHDNHTRMANVYYVDRYYCCCCCCCLLQR